MRGQSLRLDLLQMQILNYQLRVRVLHKIILFLFGLIHCLKAADLLRAHPDPRLTQIAISNRSCALLAQQVDY